MINQKFVNLLKSMQDIHERKANDYATVGNPYSNFEFSGTVAALFKQPQDISFAALIGTKLARLGELLGKGKVPQNESVQDTLLDLAVYAALWASYYGVGSGSTEITS